jgi:hypothetical protein
LGHLSLRTTIAVLLFPPPGISSGEPQIDRFYPGLVVLVAVGDGEWGDLELSEWITKLLHAKFIGNGIIKSLLR